jgi:RND family efflux transporter MFP subunit
MSHVRARMTTRNLLRAGTAVPLAMMCMMGSIACHKTEPPPSPTAIRVERVAEAHGAAMLQYVATLQPITQIDLAFRVGGYVAEIGREGKTVATGAAARGKGRERADTRRMLQSGDHVEKNTVLASLRQSDYALRLAELSGLHRETEASLSKARQDLERAAQLFETNSISRAEYDSAKSRMNAVAGSLTAASARAGQAGLALYDSKLRAPFAGTILERRVEAGALINAGTPAFSLADTSRMRAIFSVPEAVSAIVHIGATVTFQTESLLAREASATVSKISAQADPRTRAFEVEATFDNEAERFKTGMVATVRLAPGLAPEASVSVPLSAVVAHVRADGTSGFGVFVVRTGTLEPVVDARPVELGVLIGNRVIARTGLSAGDTVVTRGATLVHAGERVAVIPETSGPALQTQLRTALAKPSDAAQKAVPQ